MPPKIPLPYSQNKKDKPYSYYLDVVDEYFYRNTHIAMKVKHSRAQIARFLESHKSTDVETAILFWDNMKSS